MSARPAIDRQRLLQRFLRYVQVATSAAPDAKTYPSSEGQLQLGRLLVEELQAMGLGDARQDDNGLVWARVPATVADAPTILLNAHLDTSPEAPGEGVQPRVIERYTGGDIPLGDSGQTIRVADCPALQNLVGHTLVTTDGTTLLGGDDKAGVAAIMELAAHLMEHRELLHGAVQILLTCDEEIGQGTAKVPVADIDAVAGYTLDGSGAGELDCENFSADHLVIKAIGHNIHPSIGKGRMVNALRGVCQLVARLPQDHLSPETTEDREGFLHPYTISGGVGASELRVLLRSFETEHLDRYEALVRRAADELEHQTPGLRFEIVRERQYRNMADSLRARPEVAEFAERAYERLGRPCTRGSIRGGTDGAMLSEKGLPTPNLSVGQHNIHSVLEFVSLDEMFAAVEHLVELTHIWQADVSPGRE
ncbi:MAG: peptidase T [Aureliella sp.]